MTLNEPSKFLLLILSISVASPVFAQDAEQPQGEESEVVTDAEKEDLPEIGRDKLANFELNRGFYVGSELGAFLTIGGAERFSNAQPFIAVKVGHDIGKYFGLQLNIGWSLVSQNAISEREFEITSNQTRDYQAFLADLEFVVALRPTPRFAIEPKVGAGIGWVYPQWSNPNPSPERPEESLGPVADHFVAGVDFKYLTLLTDFSVGIGIDAHLLGMITGAQVFGMSFAGTLRYTF